MSFEAQLRDRNGKTRILLPAPLHQHASDAAFYWTDSDTGEKHLVSNARLCDVRFVRKRTSRASEAVASSTVYGASDTRYQRTGYLEKMLAQFLLPVSEHLEQVDAWSE